MGSPMEELEGSPEDLKGFLPHGKNNDFGHPDAPRLSETEPSTKGHTWFQPKMFQRKALLGISGRNGP